MTSSTKNIAPNCGIVAVAYAVNANVSEIMDLFRSVFKKSSRWQGRSSISQLTKICRMYDCPTTLSRATGRTLASFVEWETKKGVSYIVRTGDHFQHVKDGIVSDNHMSAPIADFHWKSKRVSHVIELKN
jgi:hypothetical protein